jgi:hypothetical protein
MKKEKLSLAAITNRLSRAELKKVMAGSTGPCSFCGPGGYNCCGCYNTVPHNGYLVVGDACGNGSCDTYCHGLGFAGGDQLVCGTPICTGL